MIRDWEQYRRISHHAKVTATFLIMALFSYTLFFVEVPMMVKGALALIGILVTLFIWARPTIPSKAATPPHRESFSLHWRYLMIFWV